MAKIVINISTPNDGLGNPLRTAFNSTNLNFTELYDIKVDKITGKGLSTNDYTTPEKDKLAGIAAGAEVNVQSDLNQLDDTQDDFVKGKESFLSNYSAAVNTTTSELTVATLNTTYPVALPDFKVFCESITDNPLIYIKGGLTWYSIPLGTIS